MARHEGLLGRFSFYFERASNIVYAGPPGKLPGSLSWPALSPSIHNIDAMSDTLRKKSRVNRNAMLRGRLNLLEQRLALCS